MTIDKSDILAQASSALLQGDKSSAADIINTHYQFVPIENPGRKYTENQMLQIFKRDGFIDRYSGQRLVFPGMLRLFSRILPETFPAHPNWKMSETHIAFWELFPTIDHVIPIARGGADDESNWVTTSMVRNSAKSSWLLEELDWQLLPTGSLTAWDGLLASFIQLLKQDTSHLSDTYIKKWYAAALKP